jgi:hypothetical protein
MRRVRGLVVIVAAAALLQAAAPAATVRGGLYGLVTKGPVRPVCKVGESCDAPARVTLEFSRSTAAGVLRYAIASRATGAYRIALPPGYYSVTTKQRIGIRRNIRPHAVHVRRGHWDKLDFFIDTGIR